MASMDETSLKEAKLADYIGFLEVLPRQKLIELLIGGKLEELKIPSVKQFKNHEKRNKRN